jgi:inner membrane protein
VASLFTHAFVGAALGQAADRDWRKNWRFWCLVVACSILPDIDSIGFHMGIPYGALWGHRGLTHSLLFAAILAGCLSARFGELFRRRWQLASLLFVITASHGLLDAMTDGGLGIAFFSPLDLHRYFLPWRPIPVSPIGLGGFFTTRGLHIMWSEILWIWCPTLALLAAIKIANSARRLRTNLSEAAGRTPPASPDARAPE